LELAAIQPFRIVLEKVQQQLPQQQLQQEPEVKVLGLLALEPAR
jgi:hypothetical protein